MVITFVYCHHCKHIHVVVCAWCVILFYLAIMYHLLVYFSSLLSFSTLLIHRFRLLSLGRGEAWNDTCICAPMCKKALLTHRQARFPMIYWNRISLKIGPGIGYVVWLLLWSIRQACSVKELTVFDYTNYCICVVNIYLYSRAHIYASISLCVLPGWQRNQT